MPSNGRTSMILPLKRLSSNSNSGSGGAYSAITAGSVRRRRRRRSRLLKWYVLLPLATIMMMACIIGWFQLDEERKNDILSLLRFISSPDEDEDEEQLDEEEEHEEQDEGEATKEDKEKSQEQQQQQQQYSFTLEQMKEKFASVPEFFEMMDDDNDNEDGASSSSSSSSSLTFAPKQFIHLHHMKTGGTSIDSLLRCTMDRLKRKQISNNDDNNNDNNDTEHNNNNNNNLHYTILYANIHECSEGYYQGCVSGRDQRCIDNIQKSAIMSYCAPLKDLPVFGWDTRDTTTTSSATNNNNNTRTLLETNTAEEEIENENEHNDMEMQAENPDATATTTKTTTTTAMESPTVGAMTVLRHPVDRVWSMYRFQTKSCYSCQPLADIYHDIDAGNFDKYRPMCLKQLLNHETNNLLSDSSLPLDMKFDNNNDNGDEVSSSFDSLLQEAISNMNSFFTIVGLTEELSTTVEMAGMVFPWMKERVDWSDDVCFLEHKNASPENNHCGPDGNSHMELPPYPDDATKQLIESHNALDLQLYEAAKYRFQLQKQALGLSL